MNRREGLQRGGGGRIPRTRGDEPALEGWMDGLECIPRTRGDEPKESELFAVRVVYSPHPRG